MAGNAYALELYQNLLWKVRNFPSDVYNFNPGDNLTILMSTLLGESGVGQLSAIQVTARVMQQFPYFSDLDSIFGQLTKTPRLKSELYSSDVDPFTDQLTLGQWRDVVSKDASYRERLLSVSSALLRGATPVGVQAMSEAVTQVKFQIIENWTNASGVMTASGYGRSLGPQETVLIPLVPSGLTYDNDSRTALLNALSAIQPLGTELTVSTKTLNPFTSVPVVSVTGSSEFFYLNRNVVANNLSIPGYVAGTTDPTVTQRYWLRNGQSVEAPYFAFGQTQEQIIDVTNNVSSVTVNYGTQGVVDSTSDMLGVYNLPINHISLGG